jgi:hypothetical protein
MIKITKEIMTDETDFIKVEEADGKVAVFFEGDYMCFYNHLINIGMDRATATELKETYKKVLQ